MAKVKLTKTALKQQRDDLAQFQRFLPTLQLKKQQLQMEMRTCLDRIAANEQGEEQLKADIRSWIRLFGDSETVEKTASSLKIRNVLVHDQNIAGVTVPVYEGVEFDAVPADLYETDPWVDDALQVFRRIAELREERKVIRKQYELIGLELRTTTQRVNLFEKVRIPECKGNIRRIQICISDMSTAAVARSKIAKRKLQEEGAEA